jgi:hypothetical protein
LHEGRLLLTGDVEGKFTELSLFDTARFDRDGPILTRAEESAPGFHKIAVLWSDALLTTTPRVLDAFDTKLSPLGVDILSRAIKGDGIALSEIGRFMLYEVGDFPAAFVYLERAFASGAPESALDLAVLALVWPVVRHDYR